MFFDNGSAHASDYVWNVVDGSGIGLLKHVQVSRSPCPNVDRPTSNIQYLADSCNSLLESRK